MRRWAENSKKGEKEQRTKLLPYISPHGNFTPSYRFALPESSMLNQALAK
jgi:hypothetical protein